MHAHTCYRVQTQISFVVRVIHIDHTATACIDPLLIHACLPYSTLHLIIYSNLHCVSHSHLSSMTNTADTLFFGAIYPFNLGNVPLQIKSATIIYSIILS